MQYTHLFYDIETTGLNPCFDQPIQFAAIRTKNLKEIERYEYMIHLNCDVIPNPEAMKVHGISLERINRGEKEIDATQKIHNLFNTPNTINLGYNNLSFDDEFLRFSFYRNLLSPYTHQYANGCSRMDIYPMIILYFLFKPDIIQWPEKNDQISLKLEDINAKNHFVKGASHQAMVDAEVTAILARHLSKEREMWHYLQGYFNKTIDAERISSLSDAFPQVKLSLLAGGKFGTHNNFLVPALCLGKHRVYNNQLLWLRLDTELLAAKDISTIVETSYIIRKKLGEPPIALPYKDRFLDMIDPERLKLAESNINWLQKNMNLFAKICDYYKHYTYPEIDNIDPDAALYQIPFPSREEERLFYQFHQANPEEKQQIIEYFPNPIRKEQALRILGRHYPQVLSDQNKSLFQDYLESSKKGRIDYKGHLVKIR